MNIFCEIVLNIFCDYPKKLINIVLQNGLVVIGYNYLSEPMMYHDYVSIWRH